MAKPSLSASLEDYLEAIFHIEEAKNAAKPKDIAERLHVRSASVTGALRSLAAKKLVNYAPYDLVTLTPAGRKAAKTVVAKHEALKAFFMQVLSVRESEADEAACEMEHAMPRIILERLVQYAEFVGRCRISGARWEEGYGFYCENDRRGEGCEDCPNRRVEDYEER